MGKKEDYFMRFNTGCLNDTFQTYDAYEKTRRKGKKVPLGNAFFKKEDEKEK